MLTHEQHWLPTALLAAIDQYWGRFFACSSDLIRQTPPPYLLTSAAQPGLWALTCGGGWVVAAPEAWRADVQTQIAACFRADQLPTHAQVQLLRAAIAAPTLYGPAAIFLHHAPSSRPLVNPAIRPLTDKDHASVATFAAAAGPLPWSLEQMDDWLRVFGYFRGQELVATCGVRLWGELLAEIYIDTAPAYRRHGYGKAVTAAALHWIHTATPYYVESVVDLTNEPSLRLMHSLGFTPYGYLVTVS